MVTVTQEAATFVFDVQGLHKLWALKSQLRIPAAHVRGARPAAAGELSGWWKGWRMPGTHIPGLLTAGTFYQHDKRIFWDVHNEHRAIVVDLVHDDYDQLVIEVADPAAVIALLTPTR